MSLNIKTDPRYFLIEVDDIFISEIEAKKVIDALKQQREHRPLVILSCPRVEDVASSVFRTLTRSLGTASQQDFKFAVVASETFAKMVKDNGLDRILPCYRSIGEIIGEAPKTASKDQTREFLNTLLEAVVKIFQITVNSTPKAGSPILSNSKSVPSVEIGATVGIVGTGFNGTFILAFSKKTYLAIMSRMHGVEYKDYHPDTRDGASEMVNMILGQAKIVLNEKGFGIKQAIPAVIQGTELQIFSSSSSSPALIVPFSTEFGDVYVELAMNLGK